MNEKFEKNLQRLQMFEQSIQNLMMQKQEIQIQLSEIESAENELKNSKIAYKMVGGLMVLKEKSELDEFLKEKKKKFENELKEVEEQEKNINIQAEQAQSELLSGMDTGDSNDSKGGKKDGTATNK